MSDVDAETVVAETQPEPVLDPAMEPVLLAGLIRKPEAFAEHLEDMGLLFQDHSARSVVRAHQKLLAEQKEVTLTALFQQAFTNADSGDAERTRKDREALQALRTEVQEVDVDADLPFILKNIEGWLQKKRHDRVMETYLEAFAKQSDEPTPQNREELEDAKGKFLRVLLNEPTGVKIEDAADLLKQELPEPVPVIEGVLDQGDVAIFGGASKTRKTWVSMFAAVGVASGYGLWNFKAQKGRVLYLNFELSPRRFQERLAAVSKALEVTLTREMIDVMHLKGVATKPESLIRTLISQGKLKKYSLIIIDPLYSLLAGKVENSSEEMAELMNQLGMLARNVGCAVWVTHHFSKGNQASKSAIDRTSGSGVFGRFPDTLITMTAHKEENNYTVEFVLRNHQDIEPFVVEWAYPVLRINHELDPADLKQPERGNTEKVSNRELTDCLGQDWITTAEWLATLLKADHDISSRTLQRRAKDLEKLKHVESKKQGTKSLWRNPNGDSV